jgi:LysR family hydrogen peroxide-inducible transcriptional activator
MAALIDRSPERVYRSLAGVRPKRSVVLVTNPYRYASRLQNSFFEKMREDRRN